MIRYHDYNIEGIEEFQRVLKKFDQEVKPIDVWNVARGSKEIPNFEAIYWEVVLERLANFITVNHPTMDCNYEVNGRESTFSINGEYVDDHSTFEALFRCARMNKEIVDKGIKLNGKELEELRIYYEYEDYFADIIFCDSSEPTTVPLDTIIYQLAEEGVHFYVTE